MALILIAVHISRPYALFTHPVAFWWMFRNAGADRGYEFCSAVFHPALVFTVLRVRQRLAVCSWRVLLVIPTFEGVRMCEWLSDTITLMENSVFVAPGVHSYIHCLTQCRSEDMDGFKEKRLVIDFLCIFFPLILGKHSPAPVNVGV